MLQLSLPAREALKTGLALTIACGVALAMGWSNPYWAGLAVAVVSMPTVGESINKGVHRLLGTVVGGCLGMLCVSLFPQDRWAFIACLSLVMGVSAYRITVSRYIYFWFITSYVALLIAANVATGSQHVFYTAAVRVEETALGIIIYALVSVFIWPQRCSDDLDRLVRTLLGVQAKIVSQYFGKMLEPEKNEDAKNWYGLEAQLLTQWKRRLGAAETEQYEIHEVRGWWRQLIALCQELMETLELWRESLEELRQLDLVAVLPGLPAFRQALVRRFTRLSTLGEADATTDAVLPRVELVPDRSRLEALPHYQQTALRETVHALERIEQLGQSIAACRRTINLPRRERAVPPPRNPRTFTLRPDCDSFAVMLRIMVGIWLAALAWIFIDPPGHITFIVFTGVHSLVGLMTPQMNWPKFVCVNGIGVVLAGLLYVFVMPHLSGYFALSILLFLLTTVVYYVFWDQRATMLKMAAIIPFIMLTGIQSRQTYDFALFANNAASMLLSMILAGIVSAFPFSQRPEKMFLRVMTRYFRQSGRFLSRFDPFADRSVNARAVSAMLGAMQTSVGKIGGWAAGIDYKLLPRNTPEKTAALVTSLNTITYRFKMLADAGKRPPPLREYCGGEAREWGIAIGELLGSWERGLFDADSIGMLRLRLAAMETRLEAVVRAIPAGFAEEEYAGASRLLGSYRGLYKALVAHAALAADFDWGYWREARF